jgi:ABC-type polar amino acid transport system ATPase subunit
MYLINLVDYTIDSPEEDCGLDKLDFALSLGDAFAIIADSPDRAHMFLKTLAMLVKPVSGAFYFKDKKVDFSDYRNLLPCKKKIGYIASDSAMIGNITVRENLLYMRYYFENSLSLSLDEITKKLCKNFGIYDKLDMRPGSLRSVDLRTAIAIRELTKFPDLLLIERPEDFIGHTNLDLFTEVLRDMVLTQMPIVFISYDRDFIEEFSNKKIFLKDGTLDIVK